MKNVLLTRHLESVKNLEHRFTASDDCSSLTDQGRKFGPQLATGLFDFFRKRDGQPNRGVLVVSSPAARAKETAAFVADKFQCELIAIDEFRSFQMGKLTNVTETDAKTSCPLFMNQLSLYRHGLFNSYNLSLPTGSESPRQFESRIQKGLRYSLAVAKSRDMIFVLSRSVITGLLLFVARKCNDYPRNFYGYVELGVGQVSWIQLKGEKWRIQGVDLSVKKLARD